MFKTKLLIFENRGFVFVFFFFMNALVILVIYLFDLITRRGQVESR